MRVASSPLYHIRSIKCLLTNIYHLARRPKQPPPIQNAPQTMTAEGLKQPPPTQNALLTMNAEGLKRPPPTHRTPYTP